jgi:hypothetical protein
MANLSIDKGLNLIVTIDRADGTQVYCHCTPISEAVFRKYYKILGAVYGQLLNSQGSLAGGRYAHYLLEDYAKEIYPDENDPKQAALTLDIKTGLLDEINRLTNVVYFDTEKNVWTSDPVPVARKKGVITDHELSEIVGEICFFSVVSAAAPAKMFRIMMNFNLTANEQALTSLKPMEYAATLRTSIKPADTGTSQTLPATDQLSIPS